MSHRYELNQQAINQLSNICGEDIDLEQADFHADRRNDRARVVVASVQSLVSYKRKSQRYRYQKFDPHEFGLLMIDEAHRSTANSYRQVINHFQQNPDLCLVGVTATPDRSDGIGMGNIFQSVACDYNLLWGIENGWLVAPKQVFVRVNGLDLSEVRTVGGDLDPKQLAKVVELEKNLHAMAKPIVDICGETKQAIVFTASVAQAHRLCEMIRDYHQQAYGGDCKAVSLDGSLSPQDPKRIAIVKDFKNGEIQYLVNMGVATEGFDAPNVSVVAIARPTKARSLYLQMMGRGTRVLPNTVDGLATPQERMDAIKASPKPYCTIVDFIGQGTRHKLVCSTDFMLGDEGKQLEAIRERANKISSQKDFDGTQLDAIRAAKEAMEAEREAKRKKVTVGVDYTLIEQNTKYDMSRIPKSQNSWYKRGQPSDKQKAFMLKLGYTSAQIGKMTAGQATDAIEYAIKNPRTATGRWVAEQKAKEARQNA